MAAAAATPRAFVIVVFFTWLVANMTINLYNTYILSKTHFKFPILLTGTNKLQGWIGSIIVIYVYPRCVKAGAAPPVPSRATVTYNITRPLVIVHGILTALNIGFNNASLLTISLSLNQLLKSLAPLPTAALSIMMEKKSFGMDVWASMGVVVVGTALAAIGNIYFEWGGALLCIGSVLAGAGWTVCSAMLLQNGAEKMSAVDLVFYSSPWSVLVTAVLFSCLELHKMIDWLANPSGDSLAGGLFLVVLLGGGLLGFSYDLIHNQFVKLTSSMTMAVMGNTKLILLILLSMILLEDKHEINGFFFMNIAGAVVGVIGCIWYSWSRLPKKPPPPPLSEPLKGESSKLLGGEGGGSGCVVC